MRHARLTILLLCLLLLSACRKVTPPDSYIIYNVSAPILPDYADVTIPVNIAPLNFSIDNDSVTDCVACLSYGDQRYCYGKGHKVVIDPKEWRALLTAAQGDSIQVELYSQVAVQWRRHPAFSIHVVSDSIDHYVAYRLIPPYNTYERISLAYRDLETFEETEYYNNQMLDAPKGGHCINCHAFQSYRTERMQFHVREEYAGTVVYDRGDIGKYNLKLPETISSGVYPAWHPTLNLIAYSTNKSFMEFHSDGLCKSEVQDSQSGLILFDVEHKRVIPICDEPDLMETFPTWSPDGKWLYYSVARFTFEGVDATDADHRLGRQHEVTDHYRDVRYDIYRRSFDATALTFGAPELVLDAATHGKSATLPRISPDGRWLLTCIGDYGCFHIYHPEADLMVMPVEAIDSIETKETIETIATKLHPLTAANAPHSADSYHSWSSTGRWIVFQSRRRDDNYTRLYFTYFDREGHDHNAFEMPQRDPDYELLHLRSYNIPEFILEPIRTTPAELARAIKK